MTRRWSGSSESPATKIGRVFREGGITSMEQTGRTFLGITGHKDPLILLKGIQQYPFDSVLMALNAADRHWEEATFIENLLPVAVEKKIAIIGMKIPSRGRVFREGGITSMEQAMRYVLTLPVNTIIVGISTIKDLEEDVEIARDFTPYTEEEMKQVEELTKPYYADASWYKIEW